jgi:hypothetical protein
LPAAGSARIPIWTSWVEDCGALSRSRVIARIEEALEGFPFDVVFADRADPVLLRMLREEASLGASALRAA